MSLSDLHREDPIRLTDPKLRGAPSGHVIYVRGVRLAAGAEFIVQVCGEIMTDARAAGQALVGEHRRDRRTIRAAFLVAPGLAVRPGRDARI